MSISSTNGHSASAVFRSTVSKVYPAMYRENVTELAFDDITPENPDFSSIQGYLIELDISGLAEVGLITSKLSRSDMPFANDDQSSPFPLASLLEG
ncbi:hypothetical protein Acr_23g0000900 [Actinidia rufa]|uniref:Uncharacterized protein n=1 Tax=Actinidia rufa TaxID=165716 RepID=A0A7J0GLP2_9ERIC|nr:hypothetical protein Acr_23g0000900 [Actinidia rufa]